jgi:hypothetical protein
MVNSISISLERMTVKSLAMLSLNSVTYGVISSLQKGRLNSNPELTREIPPYLPQIASKYKYTLVLDLDETLIHFFNVNLLLTFLDKLNWNVPYPPALL